MNRTIRILYYFPEKEINMHQWQRIHFFDELARNNIYIEVFNPLHYPNIDEAQLELVKYAKQNIHRFDLFFTGIGDNLLSPAIVSEIKNAGLPTLLICFDNLHAPFMHRKLAPAFDLVWLTSFETQYLFNQWGANSIFLPYAANPYFFTPANFPEVKTVGFIGTPYGGRINKIKFLSENNIQVSVYSDFNRQPSKTPLKGPRKKKEIVSDIFNLLGFSVGREILLSELKLKCQLKNKMSVLSPSKNIAIFSSLSFDEMSQLHEAFAMSLSVTDIRNTYLLRKPIYKLHLRTFEIPMSGGLQITNYTDEIASYFEDGKEIILYKSDEELIAKAKFYLHDSQMNTRKKMKMAARKRAESEHTWINRFSTVFKQLGLH